MTVFVIEIDGPQNESIIFAPLRQRLRGRWDFSRTHHREKSDAMRMLAAKAGVIPGMCLSLDIDKKIGMVFDALGETSEGKRVLVTVNEVMKDFSHVFGGEQSPHPQEHRLDADGVKTWLWYMVQLVNGPPTYARPLNGSLPTLDQVRAMPGRRRRDPGNSGAQDEKLSEWVDVVPEDAELAGVGRGRRGGQAAGNPPANPAGEIEGTK